MSNHIRSTAALLSLAAAGGLFAAPALAGTVTVTCPSATLQGAVDAAPAGTPTTIMLKGTCTENVSVPAGKSITVDGSLGGILKPKDTSEAALTTSGDTRLLKLRVVGGSGTADSLVNADGGALRILASVLSAPNLSGVAGVSANGFLGVSNSTITGGTDQTIWVVTGSMLSVTADPSAAVGAAGAVTTLSTGNATGPAISCGPGSAVRLRAVTADSQDGRVRLLNSAAGVGMNSCTLEVQNKTSKFENVLVSSMKGAGINANNSRVTLRGVRIVGSAGFGVSASMSNVLIRGSSFDNNAGGDVGSGNRSEVLFDYGSTNNLPDVNGTPPSLKCMSNSEISVPAGTITPALGSGYDASDCVRKY